MAKHLLKKTNDNGEFKDWCQVRISCKMQQDFKKIRKSILAKTNVEEISFKEITNIITRHKLWQKIVEDAGNIKEEEIIKYGGH